MVKIDREQILGFLRDHKDEMHARFGVKRLGLVGSYARGDANAESDIEIIVRLQSDNTFRSFWA